MQVGAFVAYFLFGSASEGTLAIVLAFGAAALIYLIAEELLVESIQAEKSLFSTAMLFSGFGVLLSVAPEEFIKEKPIDKIQERIEKGYFHFLKENTRIEYLPQGHKEQFNDPEEYVRAEYYYDLLEKYRYLGRRIAFEIEMPDRTPERFADIVIYEDEARARPYIVVECKKDGISDAEFEQATKQAIAARTDLFSMNK